MRGGKTASAVDAGEGVFEGYYRALGLLDGLDGKEGDWGPFLKALSQPLPVTFRCLPCYLLLPRLVLRVQSPDTSQMLEGDQVSRPNPALGFNLISPLQHAIRLTQNPLHMLSVLAECAEASIPPRSSPSASKKPIISSIRPRGRSPRAFHGRCILSGATGGSWG